MNPNTLAPSNKAASGKSEIWVGIVSFLLPLVGLGLVVAYRNSSPERVRSATYGLIPGAIFHAGIIAVLIVIRVWETIASVRSYLPITFRWH